MSSSGATERAQRAAFGATVRRLRLTHGWSQEALAHRAELDRSYVGGIERGARNVSLDNIHRLARALDVEASDLLAPEPLTGHSQNTPTVPR